MQYFMPIIGTKWRGIQSLIRENRNGFLVDIKHSEQIAEALKYFLLNPEKILQYGMESKRIFDANYTLDHFLLNIESALYGI